MVKKKAKTEREERYSKLGPAIQKAWEGLRKAIEVRKKAYRETPFDAEATFRASVAEEKALHVLYQLHNELLYGNEAKLPPPKTVPDFSV